MKTLIAAAALVALTTPAFADKQPVKPVDTCANEVNYALIMHHLAEIEAMLDKLETSVNTKKPVKDEKAG